MWDHAFKKKRKNIYISVNVLKGNVDILVFGQYIFFMCQRSVYVSTHLLCVLWGSKNRKYEGLNDTLGICFGKKYQSITYILFFPLRKR